MTEHRIRPARQSDAAAISSTRRAVFAHSVMSEAQAHHNLTVYAPEEQFAVWVAEIDHRVVAQASAGLNPWTSEPGAAHLTIYVHPQWRRRGIGADLAAAAHEHLAQIGARRIQSSATGDGIRFAQARGYAKGREVHYARVDVDSVPPAPPVPDDIRLVSLEELSAEAVYRADVLASMDEPGDVALDAIELASWVDDLWNAPDLNRGVSVAAVHHEQVVCFTLVDVDEDRAWSAMTGTIPEWRGRGLAKLVKATALHRAGVADVKEAYTSVDAENGAMTAVNAWLGYRTSTSTTTMTRLLPLT